MQIKFLQGDAVEFSPDEVTDVAKHSRTFLQEACTKEQISAGNGLESFE